MIKAGSRSNILIALLVGALLQLLLLPESSAQNKTLPYQLKMKEKLMKKKKVQIVKAYTTIEGEDEYLEFVRMYDSKGKLIKSIDYDEWNDQYLTITYSYNDNGMLIRKAELDESEEVIAMSEFEYGKHGLIKESHFNMDGAYDIIYSYNNRGLIDSSMVLEAEFRKNVWHYTGSLLDSIVGYTVYDLDQPDTWELVEIERFDYGKKKRVIKDSFCSNYSGCTNTSYWYKKGEVIRQVIENENSVMMEVTSSFKKKLIQSRELVPSDDFSDFIDAEKNRFEYTYH